MIARPLQRVMPLARYGNADAAAWTCDSAPIRINEEWTN